MMKRLNALAVLGAATFSLIHCSGAPGPDEKTGDSMAVDASVVGVSTTCAAPPPVRTFNFTITQIAYIGPLSKYDLSPDGVPAIPGASAAALAAATAVYVPFAKLTDASYGEKGTIGGADHRLKSVLPVTATCTGGALTGLGAGPATDSPGAEVGPIYGIQNADATSASINAGVGTVKMISSGHPNPILEPGFSAIRKRKNTDIWDYGTWTVTCDNNAVASISLSGKQQSGFPSINYFAQVADASGNLTLVVDVPVKQGIFANLWSLAAVPTL